MSTPVSEMSTQLNEILENFSKPDILSNPQELKKAVADLENPSAKKAKRELLGALFDAQDNTSKNDFPKLKNFAEFLHKCCNVSLRVNLGLTENQEDMLENLWGNVDAAWIGAEKLPDWQQNKPISAYPTSSEPTKKGTVSRAALIYRNNVQLGEENKLLKTQLEKAQREADMLRTIGLALGLKDLLSIKDLEAVLGSPLPKLQDLKHALELKQVLASKGLPVDSAQQLGTRVDELLSSKAELTEAYNKLNKMQEALDAARLAEKNAKAEAEASHKAHAKAESDLLLSQEALAKAKELLAASEQARKDAEKKLAEQEKAHQEALRKMQAELDAAQQACVKAEIKLTGAHEEFTKARELLAASEQARKDAEKKLAEQEKAHQEALRKMQAELDAAQQARAKAEAELTRVQEELTKVKGLLATTDQKGVSEIAHLQHQLQQAQQALASEQKARAYDISQLQRQLHDQLQQSQQALIAEQKARAHDISQFKTQLQQAQQALAAEQKARAHDVGQLKSQLQQAQAKQGQPILNQFGQGQPLDPNLQAVADFIKQQRQRMAI